MTAPQNVTPGPNPPQFDSLDADTKVVTFNIGGNDIGFSGIAESCVSASPFGSKCKSTYVHDGRDEISERIQATAPKVGAVIQGIHQRAPLARVLAVNYAAIFPERGVLGPDTFIPLAEETGLIGAIDRYVLEQTCRQARRWEAIAPGESPLRLHVNLSAVELRDPQLTSGLQALLEAFDVPAERLALEITETELLDDAVASAARFGELRALGIRIALDDFGTGYSSLSYLHSLPLDSLKIAKPFVDALEGDSHDASFIGVIVELARKLGLDVIAEGIETPAQLNALAYAQGSDIHVAPGQEKHLPHEAWHVVQQSKGRVKPTMQILIQAACNA